jgi:predicted amidohydrolase YtcJ
LYHGSEGSNEIINIEHPNLIVYNGKILTMEESQSEIEAFAIEGDKFIALGNEDDILGLAEADSNIIDLQGKTVLPGFIDSHSHWIGDRNLAEMGTPEEAIESAISNGWTSISELFVNEDRINELRSLDEQNNLRLRVNAYLPLSWQFERFGNWYQAYQPGYEYSSNLRIGGVKIFMDRWVGNRTLLYFDQTELSGLVQEAHNLGYQVAIHSVTDNATDIVLNTFESILKGESNDNYRFRIEHLVMLRNDQIQRMKDLGIIASFQFPWFNSDWEEDGDVEIRPEDLHLIARWHDLLETGVQSMGSTDFPWSEGPIGSSIEAIYQIVTRIGQLGNTPYDWMLNQTITIEQALRLITINAAYGTFQEDVKGSIKIAKFADFVILSDNPLMIPVENLKDINVLSTTIGGVTEYCAPENDNLCFGTTVSFVSSSTSMKSSTSTSNTNISPLTSPIRVEIVLIAILTIGAVVRYKKR